MRNDPVGDELRKLREEFEKIVNGAQTENDKTVLIPERIAKLFGLTTAQAKAWIKQEPNYTIADEKKQFPSWRKNRRRRYRTCKTGFGQIFMFV